MNQETRDAVREGAKTSASVVLPMIFNTLGTPACVLDVGAGEGWWMLAAHECGVADAIGVDVDGGFDDGIETVYHWNAETRDPLPWHSQEGTRWPLALCLETAEHLTPAAGDHLVAELCRVADEIVWSAAIPGQSGDGHINEQWPDYWNKRFNEHGFAFDDPWRADLWDREGVEPWYRQNLLLAYRHGVTLRLEDGKGHKPMNSHPPLPLVHPITWSFHRGVAAP